MELIPKIISQYKSSVTREIRKQYNDFRFAWQKSYYDHIIRDEESLNKIRQYIIDNPVKWNDDENNIGVEGVVKNYIVNNADNVIDNVGNIAVGNNDRCSLQVEQERK